MEQKVAQVINKGMQRDYSMDKASQEYAYENKNIRITTTGNNSFLSITNEKSTQLIDIGIPRYKCTIRRDATTGYVSFHFIDGIPQGKNIILKFTYASGFTRNVVFSRDYYVDTYGTEDITKVTVLETLDDIVGLYPVGLDIVTYRNHPELEVVEYLNGTILGNTVLGNTLILFVKGEQDYIYKLIPNGESFDLTLLFSGDLNFNVEHPIECIAFYEGDDVQKVYWVDGINQPRCINICNTYGNTNKFDFTPTIDTNIDITIEKEYNGAGLFPAGVIQYYITAFNKYGAESNAVYVSPLHYITHDNRGGEPGEICNCSFKISISETPELVNTYDGVNIYSVIRSSLNTEPAVALVNSIDFIPITPENPNPKVQVVDTNTFVNTLASSDVMFLGGNTIIAKTIENKNNTLFLGNIEEMTTNVVSVLKDSYFNNPDNYTLEFVYKPQEILDSDNIYYKYSPNLEDSVHTKYFKYLEWYRVGIQFQLHTGEWTSVIYLKDIQCNLPIKNASDQIYEEIYGVYLGDNKEEADNYDYFIKNPKGQSIYTPIIKCSLSNGINNIFSEYNIKGWRLTIAEHSSLSRTVKAQGLLLPTLFNLKEREDNTCFGTPIWNIGTALKGKHLFNIDTFKNSEGINLFSGNNLIDRTIYEGETLKYIEHLYMVGTPQEDDSRNDYYLKGFNVRVSGDRAISIATQDSLRVYISPVIGYGDEEYISDEIEIAWSHRAFGQGETVCDNLYDIVSSLFWRDFKDKTVRVEENTYKTLSEIKGINFDTTIFRGAEFYSKNELRNQFVPFTNLYKSVKTLTKEINRTLSYSKYGESINLYRDNYFLDANLCNFISPDIDNVSNDLKLRIVGYTDIANTISDYSIEVESNVDSSGTIVKPAKYNLNTVIQNDYNIGIGSFPLWPYSNSLFLVHYWQHNGFIAINDTLTEGKPDMESKVFDIKTKTFANMWVSNDTKYLNKHLEIDTLADLKVNQEDVTLFESKLYKNKYENALAPTVQHLYNIPGLNETADVDTVLKSYNNDNVKGIDVDSNVVKSVSIKSNALNHCVLDLGNVGQKQVILPNYNDSTIDNKYNQILYENFARANAELEGVTDCGILKEFTILDSGTDITDKFLKGLVSLNYATISGKLVYNVINECVEGAITNSQYTINLVIDFTNAEIINYVHVGGNSESRRLLFKYFYDNKVYYLVFDRAVYREDTTDENYDDYILGLRTSSIYTTNIKTFSFGKSSGVITLNYEPVDNNIIGTWESSKFIIDNKDNEEIKNIDSKLWIAELYLDYDPMSFMGGTNEEAIALNTFIPIAGDYNSKPNDNGVIVGYGLEGDTYYQRWDYLRIEPIASDDVNRPIDAISLMLETYQNLDGDYRQLRGRHNTITLTKENTNDVTNSVYSQSNNYKTYTVLDEKFLDPTHPTLYTWSLSKQNMSDIDNWTKVNLSSANKLDGDKGELTKLKNWNDKLLAFQEKGIAMINYNQQTTLTTSDGVPVEIANSGKVSGHYYLSTTIGCKNKWSIVSSPYGLYFIDSYNKSINVFAEAIKSLSTTNLFEDWIIQNENNIIWTPKNEGKAFKSFYDPIHKEVYFVNGNDCLCYNELLQQFTSFYDYQNMLLMEPIDGHIYSMCSVNKLYKMFEGDTYCNLFDNQCNYYMRYKINNEPFTDKVWTNIEYRADIFDKGNLQNNYPNWDPGNTNEDILTSETFDTLKVWNEYQEGYASLSNTKYPSKAKKFRIWRADIPRDKKSPYKKDRIRNPWIMLELEKTGDTSKRMEFHDLLIKYLA